MKMNSDLPLSTKEYYKLGDLLEKEDVDGKILMVLERKKSNPKFEKEMILMQIYHLWEIENNIKEINLQEIVKKQAQTDTEGNLTFDHLILNMDMLELREDLHENIINKRKYYALDPFHNSMDINKEFNKILDDTESRSSIILNKEGLFVRSTHKKSICNGMIKYETSKLAIAINITLFTPQLLNKKKIIQQDTYILPPSLTTLIDTLKKTSSKRSFISANADDIVKRLIENASYSKIAFHEVILANKPTRMYLDVDSKLTKEDGEKIRDDFLQELESTMKDFLISKMSATEGKLLFRRIILDSSGAKKFSNHIIYNILLLPKLEEIYFTNNFQVGLIVKKTKENFVTHTSHNLDDYLDLQVYSKNRNMRVIFSGKIEKTNNVRILIPTHYTKKYSDHFSLTLPPKEINKINNLDIKEKLEIVHSIKKFTNVSDLIKDSLITFVRKENIILKDENPTKTVIPITSTSKQKRRLSEDNVYTTDKNIEAITTLEKLFFFIQNELIYKKQSKIIFFEEDHNLSIAKITLHRNNFSLNVNTTSKICLIANREHKSNHVYYILDFRCKTLRQKCFDIECGNHFGNILNYSTTHFDNFLLNLRDLGDETFTLTNLIQTLTLHLLR